jgi:tRNA threonylcarbamoyladenosine biosynthesis protein TsaB
MFGGGYDPGVMRILAADTSTSLCTIALCDEDRLLAETVVDCGRTHSERLVETVKWTLDQAGLAINDLDVLAVSIGPGSFTGLRVGVAAWKGLATGARLPLVGVPTLDAMTRVAPCREGWVCPVLDARMGEVFAAAYRFDAGSRTKLTSDLVCSIDHFLDVCSKEAIPAAGSQFLGDGASLYREPILSRLAEAQIFDPGSPHAGPRASAVALEARALMKAGACTDPGLVAPVYLRKPKAEKLHARGTAS